MFVVRSKSGMVFTNTEWGENNGKEIEYETKAEAEENIEIYKQSFSEEEFYVHELNPVGRPSIGLTRKVSLTLPERIWDWFDEQAEGNRSRYLREIVLKSLGNESEWSNDAAFGYMILAAEALSVDQKLITDLRKEMYYQMDLKTTDEVKEVYNKSIY